MKVFLHLNGNLAYQLVEVDPTEKVGLLINKFSTDEASNDDYLEDVEIYRRNKDDDLDKGKSFDELGIEDGEHLFLGRCQQVVVDVNYAGKVFNLTVPPSTIARRIRRKALEHFGIDGNEGVDLLLWINQQAYLDDRNMIGSVTDYPNCRVKLILASKQDIQGSPDREILVSHLELPDYQAGVFDESWGLHNQDLTKQWPKAIFWIKGKDGKKYYLRFDLSGYNMQAPTAIAWDPEKNLKLPLKSKRK